MKNSKFINSGLILNLIGLFFIVLLILNSWLSYGYLLFLEVIFLLLVLASMTINIYFYVGEIKSLKLVGLFSIVVSVFIFFIGFYTYQETPLFLVMIGSSLLIYSEFKNANPLSNKQNNFQVKNNDYLKRAELFLEDSDFTKTIEYCEKALDQNPQLGLAYLFKLLALNEVVSVEQYVSLAKPIEKLTNDPLYKRFKQFTPQYLIEIKEKPISIEFEKRKTISETSNLLSKKDIAENLDLLERNLIALSRVHPYKNSGELIFKLENKIAITKELILESSYIKAIKLAKENNYRNLKDAFQVFSNLENYKESEKYIKKIEIKLKEIERLRRVKALKFTGKFAVIAILLSIVFNLTNTFFFKYYTINLVTNGGPNLQPILLRFNEDVDLPEVQKIGHRFDNWFLDESLTRLSNVNKMPAKDMTFYAKWLVNQYTLTFNTNGGATIQPITQDFGSLLNVPQSNKTGYGFNGWYRDTELTQPYSMSSTMPAENLTLFAKWSFNQYTITFVSNGGNSISPMNVAYESEITLPAVNRLGYSFVGWFTDSSLNNEFSLTTMPSQNLVIYANWLVNQYTITFITNGGDAIQPITQDFGSQLNVPLIIKIGYSLGGWYRNVGLTVSYNLPLTMPAESFTLYAKWVVNQYSINFVTNGGNIIATKNIDYGSGITIPNGVRAGYSFVGWYIDSSMENEFSLSTMPAENITLYAKWSINSYTLKYFSKDNNLSIGGIILDRDDQIILTSLGGSFSAALSEKGRVFIWGSNEVGNLGDGTQIGKNQPIEITNRIPLEEFDKITSLVMGGSFSAALSNSGRVFMWGSNMIGQLGDGTQIDRNTPIEITSRFGMSFDDKIISLSLGGIFTAALSFRGRVFTWGYNNNAQLGDGTIIDKFTPREITQRFPLSNDETITMITTGGSHSGALSSKGRVFTWGNNSSGQLGNGTTFIDSSPREITSRFNLETENSIKLINFGASSSMALSELGRVYAWGNNENGQLGDGTTINRSTPKEITSYFGPLLQDKISMIVTKSNSSSALSSNGKVFFWGENDYGQIGNGTNFNSNLPIDISNSITLPLSFDSFKLIAIGTSHSALLSESGNLYLWGYNFWGNLGDGTSLNKTTPFEITINTMTLFLSENYQYNQTINGFIPQKTGYIFDGWYTDSLLKDRFNSNIMPPNDLNLFAKWNLVA
jgi:uncharacterized repeat protein (TIGR02543 family)